MQVAKWGNSLAVRLPVAVVEALEHEHEFVPGAAVVGTVRREEALEGRDAVPGAHEVDDADLRRPSAHRGVPIGRNVAAG